MLAMHKTFEKSDETGKRSVTLYVSDGASAQKFATASKVEDFINSLHDETIRVTAVNVTDITLQQMTKRGVTVLYPYWHHLKIDNGLPPTEIAMEVANAPDEVFREFTPNPQYAQLKRALATRKAIMDCYNGSLKALKQIGRDRWQPEEEDMAASEDLTSGFNEIKNIKSSFKIDNKSLDKYVEKLAKEIPECALFNQIADIKGSWVTAAMFVAASGGFDRFDSVASLWHYYGLHVVNGKSPKRAKGQPISWSPQGKQAAYFLGQSIIKGTEGTEERPRVGNKWRVVYEEERAKEFAVHLEKCKGCKTANGHSTARAIRKVVKQIFKEFFLEYKGEDYEENHFKSNADIGVAAD